MTIPANDAISLNSRSHRRRSNTRSPSPRIPFFSSSQMTSRHAARKHPMSLRNRQATNGAAPPAAISVNGDLHRVVEQKPVVKGADANGKGHASPPIDWEIPRKLLHSSIGFFVIPLYTSHVPASSVVVVLSGACLFIASTDLIRLNSKRFASIYEKALGFLMRESEREKINGVIWYLMGCIFVLKFYPEDIAVASILILSWCDSIASFVGRLYGSRTSRLPQSFTLPFTSLRLPLPLAKRKSVAGFLAGAATGALIVFSFWHWVVPLGAQPSSIPEVAQHDSQPVVSFAKSTCVALVGGLLAGFAEAIDIGSLDDNLTLPIVSGGLIWAFFKLVEYIF